MKNLNTLTPKKTLLASSLAAVFLGLSACGGGGGGSDSPSKTNVQMSGAVVDDFVAFARVYVDENNNGKYDSGEPYAMTDKDGYFSIAKDGTNYCANPRISNYNYCLTANSELANGGIIRVESGRDLLTSQTYEASMSMLLNSTTSGLRITSISTLNQEIANLTTADIAALGMTKGEFQQKFNTFLATFLNGSAAVNANTIDPFAPGVSSKARAFKISIQFHKLAEAIAQAFVSANSGTVLKDFLPATYRALLTNANFTSGSIDPLSSLSTNTVAIFTSVAASTGKTNPTKATQVGELNKYLNCILGVTGDSYTDLVAACLRTSSDNDDLATKKQNLFAAEVARGVALETTYTDRLKNALAIKNEDGFDYTKQDFVTTLSDAIAKLNGTFDPLSGKGLDFPTMSGNDVKLLADGSNTNSFRIFFKADGTFTACHQDSANTPTYDILTGTYNQDANRPFLAYLNVFGSNYSLANLEPATACSTGATSCIAFSYKLPNASEIKTDIFSDTEATVFKPTLHSIPTTTQQCSLEF